VRWESECSDASITDQLNAYETSTRTSYSATWYWLMSFWICVGDKIQQTSKRMSISAAVAYGGQDLTYERSVIREVDLFGNSRTFLSCNSLVACIKLSIDSVPSDKSFDLHHSSNRVMLY
jgi:hypothetical protein